METKRPTRYCSSYLLQKTIYYSKSSSASNGKIFRSRSDGTQKTLENSSDWKVSSKESFHISLEVRRINIWKEPPSPVYKTKTTMGLIYLDIYWKKFCSMAMFKGGTKDLFLARNRQNAANILWWKGTNY